MKLLNKKFWVLLMVLVFTLSACSSGEDTNNGSSDSTTTEKTDTGSSDDAKVEEDNPFKGEELSILVSTGWMDNRYDEVLERFEDTYDVVVDLQAIPADQYSDILQSKLATNTCADVFWIQSNPFAIGTTIIDPEEYCLDFTGAEWGNIMSDARRASGEYDGNLYGLQIWHNSPEFVMVYNKTLFDELGLEAPATYEELKSVSATIYENGITPWFIPGADGWQHQLSFFQIGGVYEGNQPGLFDALNNNEATFADNETMLTVLEQFKEMSSLGYFGEDWIGSNSANMINDFADRNIAMAMANSSYIKQIQDETGTSDEYGLFLIPFADNNYFPTNPAGPTMFGYNHTEHPELVKAFFEFVTTSESLQSILDNSPAYTNLDVYNRDIDQHWIPAEETFMATISTDQMAYPVLQTGTKYTNDYWMDFGADMVAYCLDVMEANDVLKNMDINRAESAKVAGDPAWE